ncbi:hypothetical protein ACFX2A_007145 [Malus domestica]
MQSSDLDPDQTRQQNSIIEHLRPPAETGPAVWPPSRGHHRLYSQRHHRRIPSVAGAALSRQVREPGHQPLLHFPIWLVVVRVSNFQYPKWWRAIVCVIGGSSISGGGGGLIKRFETKCSGVSVVGDCLNSKDFRCLISLEIMVDPVTIATGQSYFWSVLVAKVHLGSSSC